MHTLLQRGDTGRMLAAAEAAPARYIGLEQRREIDGSRVRRLTLEN
jgi:hypothetical protein